MNALAMRIAGNALRNDPELDSRIARDTEANRMGYGVLELSTKDGRPVKCASVKLKQLRQEFHFGCNGFMHKQFKDDALNQKYEEVFKSLFNLAVVPFYWSDLEPVQGKPRFAKDSPPAYRRPAPDALLEFCEANGIEAKGHVLCWHCYVPKWAETDKRGMAFLLEKRIAEIAGRYGSRIRIWDVCNEALLAPLDGPVPENHVDLSFSIAARYFPKTSVLTYNDYACWENRGECAPFYMLGRHLKELGVNFGAMGLQYHMFNFKRAETLDRDVEPGYNPGYLLGCLDQYAKIGVPLNISEITIASGAGLGEDFQAAFAEKLYRAWFSHPAVNGIIYWNLVEGSAAACPERDENDWRGGLLNCDLTPKPAFNALRNLISKEWRTSTSLAYEDGELNKFHGFYGDYEASIEANGIQTKKLLKLSKGAANKFKLVL